MKTLIAAVLFSIVMVGCSNPTPTPDPTPTPTPTTRERVMERDLPVAQGVAAQFSSLTSVAQRDLPGLEEQAGQEFMDMVCRISSREFAPDLYPVALTEDGDLYFAIKDYCKETRWGDAICLGCDGGQYR